MPLPWSQPAVRPSALERGRRSSAFDANQAKCRSPALITRRYKIFHPGRRRRPIIPPVACRGAAAGSTAVMPHEEVQQPRSAHRGHRTTAFRRVAAMLVATLFTAATLVAAGTLVAPGARAWAQPGPDRDQQRRPRKSRQRPGRTGPPARHVSPPPRVRHAPRQVRRDSRFRFVYTYHDPPRRYQPRPFPRYWHQGHWVHGWYGPYFGWWWVVGAMWYLYPAPIYPYPTVVVEPAPPAAVVNEPSAPPPPQYWYYCPGSRSYYPYVSECPGGWQKVPASPPGATPSTPAASPQEQR